MNSSRTKYNKALLSDKFSAALQICRRARRYAPIMIRNCLLLTMLFAFNVNAEQCKISDDPVLWTYGYCYSLHESQDPTNKTIIGCVSEAKDTIKKLGACAAKTKYKSLICEVGDFYNGTFNDCISSHKAAGPTAKSGVLPSA